MIRMITLAVVALFVSACATTTQDRGPANAKINKWETQNNPVKGKISFAGGESGPIGSLELIPDAETVQSGTADAIDQSNSKYMIFAAIDVGSNINIAEVHFRMPSLADAMKLYGAIKGGETVKCDVDLSKADRTQPIECPPVEAKVHGKLAFGGDSNRHEPTLYTIHDLELHKKKTTYHMNFDIDSTGKLVAVELEFSKLADASAVFAALSTGDTLLCSGVESNPTPIHQPVTCNGGVTIVPRR